MSGLFDWHVTGILSRTWREKIAPSPDHFASLFLGAGGQQSVQPSVLEGWHTSLTRGETVAEQVGHVKFNTAYNPNQAGIPQVSIAGMEEPAETQPLGYEGVPVDGQETFTMLMNENVEISIYATHVDIIRALHVVVRGIMMSNMDDFGKLGYPGASYVGAGPTVPFDELMPGASSQPQVWMRNQMWKSQTQPIWKRGAVRYGSPLVHAFDATVSGIDGGVEGDSDI